jgi:deoxyribonuclease-4
MRFWRLALGSARRSTHNAQRTTHDAPMPFLGAHMSIAGGLPLAVDRAVAHGCDALQIFSKSSSQWRARPLDRPEIREFRARVERAALAAVVAHASYLINLGSAAPALRAQSLEAFGIEIDRAEALGLLGVVIHPGCYTTGTEDDGLRLVAEAIRDTLRSRRRGRALVLLEHTAGQGTALGWRFEQLARVIGHLDGDPRVGVCLDTCHLFAAGYDLANERGYRHTFDRFRRTVGLDRLRVLHLNDSKKPLGSRRDRHEHIGRGELGLDAFRRLVNDRRFSRLPMLLETPKTEGRTAKSVAVDPLDEMNLKTLRGLVR